MKYRKHINPILHEQAQLKRAKKNKERLKGKQGEYIGEKSVRYSQALSSGFKSNPQVCKRFSSR